MFTDKQIEAATDAYLAARWPLTADWKKAWPEHYAALRERMRTALEAAANAVAG